MAAVPYSTAAGDFNNDGDGTFRTAPDVPVGSSPGMIVTGDFDGDGPFLIYHRPARAEGRSAIMADDDLHLLPAR